MKTRHLSKTTLLATGKRMTYKGKGRPVLNRWFASPRGYCACNGYLMIELYNYTAAEDIETLKAAGMIDEDNNTDGTMSGIYNDLHGLKLCSWMPAPHREPRELFHDALKDCMEYAKEVKEKNCCYNIPLDNSYDTKSYSGIVVNAKYLRDVLTLLGAGIGCNVEMFVDTSKNFSPVYFESRRGMAMILSIRPALGPEVYTLENVRAGKAHYETLGKEAA